MYDLFSRILFRAIEPTEPMSPFARTPDPNPAPAAGLIFKIDRPDFARALGVFRGDHPNLLQIDRVSWAAGLIDKDLNALWWPRVNWLMCAAPLGPPQPFRMERTK